MFTTGDSKEACARRRQEMLAFLQAVDVPLDTSYLRRGSWEWFDDLGQVVALCMTKEPYAREVAHGEGDWRALLGLTVSIVTSVMKTAADEEVSFLEMVMLAVYAASCKAYDDLYQGKVPPELARRMAGANRRMYETGKELMCFVNLSFHKTASVRFTRQREDSSRTSVALAPILSSPTTPRA